MVNVNFNGRLGADAEIRSDKNGRAFVTFRVATDEFKNGKKETAWLRVIDNSERGVKLAQYLKKGSLVEVHGIETIGTYVNKNNEVVYTRDVRADRVDFIGGSNNGQNTSQDTTQIPTVNVTPNPTPSVMVERSVVTDDMSCGTFAPPPTSIPTPTAAMSMASAGITSDAEDDLPF